MTSCADDSASVNASTIAATRWAVGSVALRHAGSGHCRYPALVAGTHTGLRPDAPPVPGQTSCPLVQLPQAAVNMAHAPLPLARRTSLSDGCTVHASKPYGHDEAPHEPTMAARHTANSNTYRAGRAMLMRGWMRATRAGSRQLSVNRYENRALVDFQGACNWRRCGLLQSALQRIHTRYVTHRATLASRSVHHAIEAEPCPRPCVQRSRAGCRSARSNNTSRDVTPGL